MIDSGKMLMLLNKGAKIAQQINDTLEENDDLRALPTNLMVIGALLYAAAWARKSDLDVEAFVTLAVHGYQQVDIEKKDEEPKIVG